MFLQINKIYCSLERRPVITLHCIMVIVNWLIIEVMHCSIQNVSDEGGEGWEGGGRRLRRGGRETQTGDQELSVISG